MTVRHRSFSAAAAAAVLLFQAQCHAAKQSERNIQIMNQSGHRVNVYWINRWDHDKLVLNNQEPVLFGADMAINSFATHEFEIQEVPHSKTNECSGPDGKCRSAQFQVNSNDGQIIKVKKDFVLEHVDNKSIARDEAREILQACRTEVTEKSKESNASPEDTMNDLFDCVNNGLNDSLQKSQEEIDFQRGIRMKLGANLATYACADDKLNTTSAIRNETIAVQRKRYHVGVLHERPTSAIHYIENFVSDEECSAAKQEASLETVIDKDGLSAKTGTIPVTSKAVFKSLRERAIDYTKQVLTSAQILHRDPQDDVIAIRYGVGDDYKAHCLGMCNGEAHKANNRIASLIMYCETADKGGSTIFHNAGILVKPKKGSAVFVSYVDPATQKMDTGITELTGCQVREGEKYVLTQHVRLGGDGGA